MESTIGNYLGNVAKDLISRYHARRRFDRRIKDQLHKRTSHARSSTLNPPVPDHWNVHRQFNPFKVQSNQSYYARAVARSLESNDYQPMPAIRLEFSKNGRDGSRQVDVFSVVDRAVSNWLFERLYERNQARFHPASFAYRPDTQPADAIEYLNRQLEPDQTYFTLTCDFKNFFYAIDHNHLRQALNDRFSVTKDEMRVIDRFLHYEFVERVDEYGSVEPEVNETGVSPGSTLSLFLSNVACDELDHQLGESGATFVRYADDILIFCENRSRAETCQALLNSFGGRAGPAIHTGKSRTIRRFDQSVSFLGFGLNPPEMDDVNQRTNIGFRKRSLRKIKDRVSDIIYHNLLHHPMEYEIDDNRFHDGVDWDLVNCIAELRHYLYGPDCSEDHVRNGLDRPDQDGPRMSSVLSFYCAVTDDDVFRRLDKWMLEQLFTAHRKRIHLLEDTVDEVTYYSRQQLINASWLTPNQFPDFDVDPRIPSFLYGWLYAKKQRSNQ